MDRVKGQAPTNHPQLVSLVTPASYRALALLLATMLLAGCDIGSAPTVQSSPTTSTSPSPTTTIPTAAPTPTPIVTVHGDWQTFTDVRFGFRLDVPAILTLSFPASGPDDSSVSGQYDTSKGQPPSDQTLYAEITVNVYATDTSKPGYPNACTLGRPITIGSGVTAYEDDNPNWPTPSPGGGATGPQGLDVNVVTGGVYISISLFSVSGKPPSGTLGSRYGAIWQHILNSFVPGPTVPNGNPCG